jgi:hypothetical protein
MTPPPPTPLFAFFHLEVGEVATFVGSIPPPRPNWTRGALCAPLGAPCVGYAPELGPRLDGHRQPNLQSRAVDRTCDRHRRCALPSYAFQTRGAPFTDVCARCRMHVQPHSSTVQLPDITVAPSVPGCAARRASVCVLCRLPTREPRPRVHAQACKLQNHHSTTWRTSAARPLTLTPRVQCLRSDEGVQRLHPEAGVERLPVCLRSDPAAHRRPRGSRQSAVNAPLHPAGDPSVIPSVRRWTST